MRKRVLTKQVGVIVTEETYQRLIEITDEREIPISMFVRETIEDKINRYKGDENNE